VFFARYTGGDEIREDEMGGACGRHAEEEKCITDFDKET
jgi:hypothetical protein